MSNVLKCSEPRDSVQTTPATYVTALKSNESYALGCSACSSRIAGELLVRTVASIILLPALHSHYLDPQCLPLHGTAFLEVSGLTGINGGLAALLVAAGIRAEITAHGLSGAGQAAEETHHH